MSPCLRQTSNLLSQPQSSSLKLILSPITTPHCLKQRSQLLPLQSHSPSLLAHARPPQYSLDTGFQGEDTPGPEAAAWLLKGLRGDWGGLEAEAGAAPTPAPTPCPRPHAPRQGGAPGPLLWEDLESGEGG